MAWGTPWCALRGLLRALLALVMPVLAVGSGVGALVTSTTLYTLGLAAYYLALNCSCVAGPAAVTLMLLVWNWAIFIAFGEWQSEVVAAGGPGRWLAVGASLVALTTLVMGMVPGWSYVSVEGAGVPGGTVPSYVLVERAGVEIEPGVLVVSRCMADGTLRMGRVVAVEGQRFWTRDGAVCLQDNCIPQRLLRQGDEVVGGPLHAVEVFNGRLYVVTLPAGSGHEEELGEPATVPGGHVGVVSDDRGNAVCGDGPMVAVGNIVGIARWGMATRFSVPRPMW